MGKWLCLFGTKGDAVGWMEPDEVRNNNEYAENDAFKGYLTDAFGTGEPWDVRECMIARFGIPLIRSACLFIAAERKAWAVRRYLDEKQRLGNLYELKDKLIESLPAEIETAFAGITVHGYSG